MSDRLQVKVLDNAAFIPPILKPAREGDVGLDLVVCIEEEKVVVPAQGFLDLPSGLAVKLPWNTWASIRPRSSTFAKKRLIVFDGTLDEAYVGPILVMAYNPNKYDVVVKRGERLAQLVIHSKVKFSIEYTDELPNTERGENGFGSTGE